MKSILILCIAQILLVNMLHSLSINDLHACPERALWRMRAAYFCANKTKQYHCLFDTFYRRYDEYCLSSKPFKSGLRIVFSGDLHAEDCRNPRYSPISVVSNDSAECNFLTSNCKEEGQVIVDNATSNTDITCRCDYTKGYNYIIQPKDPCKCSPVEEDCSCYFNTCPGIGYTLNQDYHCVNRTLKTFICSLLEKSRNGVLTSSNPSPKEFDFNETGPLLNRHTGHLKYYILLSLCLMLIVTVMTLVFELWCRNRIEFSACFQFDMKKITLSKPRENKDKLETTTEIFRQKTDMQCMQNYQPTKQINDIENELKDRCQSNLLILEGFSGSVCHSEKNLVRRMTDKKITEISSFYNILTFHELTMCVLNLIDNEKEDEISMRSKRQSRTYFLLKMFCFEIDIDARTDVTLDRNMQFLPHAEKLLNELELPAKKKDSPEVKFYLSYLHCAIGSTLLYQRNDVESAHRYLLKSRSLCLELVRIENDLLVHELPTEKDIQEILDTAFLRKFDSTFVLEFVKSKRRSESEKDVIFDELDDLKFLKKEADKTKEEFKYHYLNNDDLYDQLLKKNLALPVKDISETFVYELFQRILHNNSRAWNELRYITTDETTETLRKASHSEVVFSNSLCRLMKKKKVQNVFVCLESDRSGRMLERWTQDTNSSDEVDDDIAFYEAMLQEKSNNYFDFGILKLSPRQNDRHIAMCKRILLWFLELRFTNQKKDNAEITFGYGKTILEELQAQINQMQNQKYTWLTLPLLHIQCAKFLRLSSCPYDLTTAEHLFTKAVSLEESRGVTWSRFMWEGYVGALDCIRKSDKPFEEKKIIEEVTKKLTGTNRKYLIEKLRETKLKTF
ncbi:unnamed protein product [Mytilus edulis]|uniref:Uncharacterized protein n=1 Tax=Mytilus edulis TaxID=6550 RepID=A0A8S3UTC3_MYTED|nr:unnamed protein product [Mytilus edulis]